MISNNGTIPVEITIQIANRRVVTKKNWRQAKDWLWKLYRERDWRQSLEKDFQTSGGIKLEGTDSDRMVVITSKYFDKTVSVWSSHKVALALKYFDHRMREVAVASRPKSFGAPARAKAIEKEKRRQSQNTSVKTEQVY